MEETRGRAFHVEGRVCAKAPRSERATLFLQEEVSATPEVDSLAECR